jgi:hypothetical protein
MIWQLVLDLSVLRHPWFCGARCGDRAAPLLGSEQLDDTEPFNNTYNTFIPLHRSYPATSHFTARS